MHILRNVAKTLSHTFYVGETATAATGAVTYTVTKADGTTLASGTASAVAGATGKYEFTLAAQANLNILKVSWTATVGSARTEVDYHEIVGAHLFTVQQARAFGIDEASADQIEEERGRIADDLEFWTGVSWIPRFKRHLTEGDNGDRVHLPSYPINALLTASISGVSQTVSDITVLTDSGLVVHETGNWTRPTRSYPQNVVLEYEYGYERPMYGVDRIALLIAKERIVGSDIPASAISFSDDMGTYRYERGKSRIPEVNEWVREHSRYVPVW